jgi:hypothetical protein
MTPKQRDRTPWPYRVLKHDRRGPILYQVNVPKDPDICDFEVVALKNGTPVRRAIFWYSSETYEEAIEKMDDELQPVTDQGCNSEQLPISWDDL